MLYAKWVASIIDDVEGVEVIFEHFMTSTFLINQPILKIQYVEIGTYRSKLRDSVLIRDCETVKYRAFSG